MTKPRRNVCKACRTTKVNGRCQCNTPPDVQKKQHTLNTLSKKINKTA